MAYPTLQYSRMACWCSWEKGADDSHLRYISRPFRPDSGILHSRRRISIWMGHRILRSRHTTALLAYSTRVTRHGPKCHLYRHQRLSELQARSEKGKERVLAGKLSNRCPE